MNVTTFLPNTLQWIECTWSPIVFCILRVTSSWQMHTNPNWLVDLTCHFQLPKKLNFSLYLGNKFKLMYFNPGESGLTFYWIDFTQFLLNLTIERAPYLAWKAVFFVTWYQFKLIIIHKYLLAWSMVYALTLSELNKPIETT